MLTNRKIASSCQHGVGRGVLWQIYPKLCVFSCAERKLFACSFIFSCLAHSQTGIFDLQHPLYIYNSFFVIGFSHPYFVFLFFICIWRPYLMAHEGRCVATQEWQSSHSHTSQPPLSNFGFTRINPATIYFKGIKLEFGVLHLKTSSRLIHSQFHLGTCLPAWSPNEKRENRIVFRFCVSQQNM